MPTVAVYVPMNVARRVAARWQIEVTDDDFFELVRGVCSSALEEECAFEFLPVEQDPLCRYAKFHMLDRRCRHCGGS